MKRTTIFVPESLERELQLYAKRTGKPAAAVVREAIAEYIADDGSRAKLPSFTGAFDGPFTDTAERHEELLFDGLTPHGKPRTAVASRGRARQRRISRRR
jgi:hypothetical protein